MTGYRKYPPDPPNWGCIIILGVLMLFWALVILGVSRAVHG